MTKCLKFLWLKEYRFVFLLLPAAAGLLHNCSHNPLTLFVVDRSSVEFHITPTNFYVNAKQFILPITALCNN